MRLRGLRNRIGGAGAGGRGISWLGLAVCAAPRTSVGTGWGFVEAETPDESHQLAGASSGAGRAYRALRSPRRESWAS